MYRLRRRHRGSRGPWVSAPDPRFVNCPRSLVRLIKDSVMKEGASDGSVRGRTRQTMGIVVFDNHMQVRYVNPYVLQAMKDPIDDSDGKENDIKIEIAKLAAQLHESPETNMISRILESPDRHESAQPHIGRFRVRAIQIKQERMGSNGKCSSHSGGDRVASDRSEPR